MRIDLREAVEEKLRNRQPITDDERAQLEEDMATDINNAVYIDAVLIYERAEGLGLLYGNGHIMAQDLTKEASNRLKDRFKAREIDASQTARKNLSVV